MYDTIRITKSVCQRRFLFTAGQVFFYVGAMLGLKSGQEQPKSDPRATQERPRAAQERLKSAQERPRAAKSGPRAAQERTRVSRMVAGW